MIQLLDKNSLSTHELDGKAVVALNGLNYNNYREFFNGRFLVCFTDSWYFSVIVWFVLGVWPRLRGYELLSMIVSQGQLNRFLVANTAQREFLETRLANPEIVLYDDLAQLQDIPDGLRNRMVKSSYVCGVGSGVQESLVFQYNYKLICIGAGLDFVSKKQDVCPLWLSNCGCEWIFRLIETRGRTFSRIFPSLRGLVLFAIDLFALKTQISRYEFKI